LWVSLCEPAAYTVVSKPNLYCILFCIWRWKSNRLCRLCWQGKCPKGITTQEKELRKLNIDESAQNVANYIKNSTEEIKMAAGACGENDIHKLNKGHLRALTQEISTITGIKLISQ